MNPFFSICIPSTNRGKTIFNTLCSVAKQTFRDFELIIVDCGSSDKTRSEIDRFFNSSEYLSNKFDYKFETREYLPKTVEDWNEPIRLAKGTYVAMLEGDDQFPPNHLQEVYEYLSAHDNVGLYTKGGKGQKRPIIGLVKSPEWIKNEIKMICPAAPSQSIFIRLSKNGKPFLYNDRDYEYSPECDLYVRIASDGYNSYHSEKMDIIRYPSSHKKNTWHYFVDRFTLLDKYGDLLSEKEYKESLFYHSKSAISASLRSDDFEKFIDFTIKIIKKTSFNNYVFAFIKSIVLKIKQH